MKTTINLKTVQHAFSAWELEPEKLYRAVDAVGHYVIIDNCDQSKLIVFFYSDDEKRFCGPLSYNRRTGWAANEKFIPVTGTIVMEFE